MTTDDPMARPTAADTLLVFIHFLLSFFYFLRFPFSLSSLFSFCFPPFSFFFNTFYSATLNEGISTETNFISTTARSGKKKTSQKRGRCIIKTKKKKKERTTRIQNINI